MGCGLDQNENGLEENYSIKNSFVHTTTELGRHEKDHNRTLKDQRETSISGIPREREKFSSS